MNDGHHSLLWDHVELGKTTDLELKAARFRGQEASAPSPDSLADELGAFGNYCEVRLVLGVGGSCRPQSLDRSQLNAHVHFVHKIFSEIIVPFLDCRACGSRFPGSLVAVRSSSKSPSMQGCH